jgi:hypothetical protein
MLVHVCRRIASFVFRVLFLPARAGGLDTVLFAGNSPDALPCSAHVHSFCLVLAFVPERVALFQLPLNEYLHESPAELL